MYSPENHTFALCAFRESEYLEECICSLKAQSVSSNIIITTSTPNAHIQDVSMRYDVPLSVNKGSPGIASDWNYAVSAATTPLVTIAHQDDIYEVKYTERMLEAINKAQDPLLFFTNYGELRAEKVVEDNRLLRVKRLMLHPLRYRIFVRSHFVRRRILSLGSAICCPSVTLILPKITLPLFNTKFSCDLDWDAWERVSRLDGSFLYDPNILMYHRIHAESETTSLIEDSTRNAEDLAMFERFWPQPIARCINRFYASSQKSNS